MTSWESLAATKRAQQLSLIPTDLLIDSTTLSADADVTSFPSTSGLLTALEVEITEVESIEYLLEKLRKGEWKAKEVCGAFCRRALIAQQLVSFLQEGRRGDDGVTKSGKTADVHFIGRPTV